MSSLKGIVVDDRQAECTGSWTGSGSSKVFVEWGYLHDGNEEKGKKRASFVAELEDAGRYEVRFSYPPNGNRATNVPVTVVHAGGEEKLVLNQRGNEGDAAGFVSLGTFNFAAGKAVVVVSNEGTDGYVVVDAVQWVPVK